MVYLVANGIVSATREDCVPITGSRFLMRAYLAAYSLRGKSGSHKY